MMFIKKLQKQKQRLIQNRSHQSERGGLISNSQTPDLLNSRYKDNGNKYLNVKKILNTDEELRASFRAKTTPKQTSSSDETYDQHKTKEMNEDSGSSSKFTFSISLPAKYSHGIIRQYPHLQSLINWKQKRTPKNFQKFIKINRHKKTNKNPELHIQKICLSNNLSRSHYIPSSNKTSYSSSYFSKKKQNRKMNRSCEFEQFEKPLGPWTSNTNVDTHCLF